MWLRMNDSKSPQTQKQIGRKLVPNSKLKEAIEKYKEAYQSGVEAEISWPSGGLIPSQQRCLRVPSSAAPSQEEPPHKRARTECDCSTNV